MSRSNAEHYELEQLISRTNLAESWLATNVKTGQRCFLKRLPLTSNTDRNTLTSIVLESLKCQKLLKNEKLLTAKSKYVGDKEIYIEYPYLDMSTWVPLSSMDLLEHWPKILIKMALLVDYIHLMGLVHCDLKLEHILVNCKTSEVIAKIIDLDFLTRSYTSPKARIFGTPNYIAPEILKNDVITAESDNYSLGMSLKSFIGSLDKQSTLSNSQAPSMAIKLNALAEDLAHHERLHRPRMLCDALRKHDIINRHDHQKALRELFSMMLVTHFRIQVSKEKSKQRGLGQFLKTQVNVYGLHEDVAKDWDLVFRKSPVAAFLLFRSLLKNTQVELCGDYWFLHIPDHVALPFFQRVEDILAKKDTHSRSEKPGAVGELRRLVTRAEQFKSQKEYLKSYLYFTEARDMATRGRIHMETHEKKRILSELYDLAQILHRPNDAIEILRSTLDIVKDKSNEYLSLLEDLAELYIACREYASADKVIDLGLEQSHQKLNQEAELAFQRQRAWVLSARSMYNEAEKIYEFLIEYASSSDLTTFLMRVYNDLGTLKWRQGDFKQSRVCFEKCVSIASQNELLTEAVSPYRNLAFLCFEQADYKKAVNSGRCALRIIQKPSDKAKFPFICSIVGLAYARLGEYKKAEFWLNRSIAEIIEHQHLMIFADYYQFLGWLQMIQGDMLSAKESETKVLEILESVSPGKTLGKAYHILAEISLQEGKSEACTRYLKKAESVFEELGEQAATAETRFLHGLNNYIYQDKWANPSRLVSHFKQLMALNCRYYASLCLFYILLSGTRDQIQNTLEASQALQPLIDRQDTPLLKAVVGLKTWYSQHEPGNHQDPEVLKAVYRVLNKAGHTFLALLVCEKIAVYYQHTSNLKLAKRFLVQSIDMAQVLRNEIFIEIFSNKAQELSQPEQEQHRIVQTLHRISGLIKSITNYRESLQEIVRYAVSETGAERGVLLLKSQDSEGFLLKAFVGCDETSLVDITDFSKTIPHTVLKDRIPLVIDDAMKDKRTKEYRSIIAHNILSVICIPIVDAENVQGVLYLDHHTIPALFEKDDVTYVSAIANFLSVIVSKSKEFKTISATAYRLRNNLTIAGVHCPFITQNKTMLNMLSKLPEIARSNASVLLCGESGTGKEILAEMIHDMSLRSRGPLVKLNCSAIPATLIEGELFGVAKNVATGVSEREGKFSAADSGTLFLDEIGDMQLEIQAKVLRVLEYQQFEKVGSNRAIITDVRFVYATNKDLKKLIAEGKFRADLLYRINTITIEIPPLRDRVDDIPLLIEHFSKVYAQNESRRPRFSQAVIEALISYSWPGNVRELRNFVERLCILNSMQYVQLTDLPTEFLSAQKANLGKRRPSNEVEKATIEELLKANSWNQSRVAEIMGLPLTTLRRRIKKYGIIKES